MSKAIARLMLMMLFVASGIPAALADQPADIAVIRNTVINILEAMVQKNLLTREQADQLVQQAQKKAEAEQVAKEQAQAAQPGDVRVTYVPETVRAEITKDVSAQVKDEVTKSVVQTAKTEGWGVPAALPEWVRNATWSGDVRVREVDVGYSPGNAQYLNYQAINQAGGQKNAGANAILNTTNDDNFLSARVRFGGVFPLASYLTTGFRITTGTTDNPVSRDIQLGNYDRGGTLILDQAWMHFYKLFDDGDNRLDAWFGKIPNPYESSELVWDADVTFNGLALQYAYHPAGLAPGRGPFGTFGIYPLRNLDISSSSNKWMWGIQGGYEFVPAEAFLVTGAIAYYDYRNISGTANAPDSTLNNYTAPEWVQKGNTMFPLGPDPTNSLYGLAADYQLLDVLGEVSYFFDPERKLDFSLDYVRNIGYSESNILVRTGATVPARINGYRTELRFGMPEMSRLWAWRAFAGYTYLQRDAVLDAFTDSDFHRGGTDAKGYFFGGDLGLARNAWIRMRYLSTDAINNAPLSINSLYFDLNAKF